jgi:hypothetical protein
VKQSDGTRARSSASDPRGTPPAVVTGVEAVEVAAGGDLTCARSDVGATTCWSMRFDGEEGRRIWPTPIAAPVVAPWD